jgi:hypothetical protein
VKILLGVDLSRTLYLSLGLVKEHNTRVRLVLEV